LLIDGALDLHVENVHPIAGTLALSVAEALSNAASVGEDLVAQGSAHVIGAALGKLGNLLGLGLLRPDVENVHPIAGTLALRVTKTLSNTTSVGEDLVAKGSAHVIGAALGNHRNRVSLSLLRPDVENIHPIASALAFSVAEALSNAAAVGEDFVAQGSAHVIGTARFGPVHNGGLHLEVGFAVEGILRVTTVALTFGVVQALAGAVASREDLVA